VTEKPKLKRGNRAPERGESGPELGELLELVDAQAQELDQLRREVGWLSEELMTRDVADLQSGALSDEEADSGRISGHVRRLVHECVPRGSLLVVVSSGDETLLRYVGCKAEHLSQDRHGRFTDHPSCARAAVVQLEAARWRGADVLVIPENGLWWLDHYREFTKHLERTYTPLLRKDGVALIWDLRVASPLRAIDDMLAGLPVRSGSRPVVLDWFTGHDLATAFPDYKVFSPIEKLPRLPYLDHTVEVVAIPEEGRRKKLAEARRVASDLVISVGSGSPPGIDTLWRSPRLSAGHEDVSVVAVSRDGRPLSLRYVRQLLDSLPASFRGEVLVGMGHDAVVPRLGPEAASLKRLKVISFRVEDGFAARVRQGAEVAKGEIIVVVDGSTWPVSGWLQSLVRLLREVPGIAVAAGMFVLPDGRPLDRIEPPGAGDVSSGASSPDDDLDAPHRRYMRPLELTQDSLLATHRDLLLETDPDGADLGETLAMHARAMGLTTLFQPETLAILPWRMGQAGTDLESADG
jgi:hypothetical protein